MLDELLTELKLRNLSDKTILAYMSHNIRFLKYVKKDEQAIAEKDVKSYIAHVISDRKSSPKTAALVKASLKFYYGEVLKKNVVNFKTPKIEKHLPTVLTRSEVKRLIGSAKKEKSKLILMVLYSSGLRLSECINLKLKDLELEER